MPKIKRFKVDNLFGCLNHDVSLNDEGITFIHGPNGCGKTTLLKILDGCLSLKLDNIRNIDFAAAEIFFDDNSSITVKRKLTTNEDHSGPSEFVSIEQQKLGPAEAQISLDLIEKSGDRQINQQELLQETTEPEEIAKNIRKFPDLVTRYLPHLVRTGTRSWREKDGRQLLTPAAIAEKFGSAFPFNIPPWYRAKMLSIPRGYIKTQRLLELREDPSEDSFFSSATLLEVVDLYAEELKLEMAATIERSAINSQSQERSFPQRILSGDFQSAKEPELREKYLQLQERLKELSAVGLQETTDDIALPKKKFNPTMRRVLSLYLSDLNDKLDTFLELQQKIRLIKDLFGTKLRRKEFQITRNAGFLITDRTKHDLPLKPSDLSSGEQHQLVMLYQLVFSNPSGQLFLIDEPEISLHVEWQRMFLDDLIRIAALRGHSFLIATHSPQIINNRLDLAVALDGGIQL